MLVFSKNTVTVNISLKAPALFQHSEITTGFILLISLTDDDVWNPFKIMKK